MTDIALTEGEMGGAMLAHRLDCPMVLRHRREGRPIMNMFGCKEPLPDDIERHWCLPKKTAPEA